MSLENKVPQWDNKFMKIFAERLRAARKSAGYGGAELSRLLSVGSNTISRWETGSREPSLEMINKIADALNVSVSYLVGEEAVAQKIPDGIRPDFLKSSGKIIQVPIYGKELAACCGEGFPDSDQIYAYAEEFIAMPSSFLGPVSTDPNYRPFIIYAEGDSMVNAGIHDGAQVIINPYDDVLDGDAALVEFATNTVTRNIAIKRVYWLDRCAIELRSACDDGWKRTFTADDFDEKSIRIIGKVEWVGNKPKRG